MVVLLVYVFFVVLALTAVVGFLFADCDFVLLFYFTFKKSSLKKLKGKVVWITGASSGIGECLAYTLAPLGVKLVLSARTESKLIQVLDKCKDLSPVDYKGSHMVVVLDMLKYDSHKYCVEKVLLQYGKIDYLVNNAGRSQKSVATDTTIDVQKYLLEVNTLGTINLTNAILPHMMRNKDGSVVIISSIAGKIGSPMSAGYSASKHAIQGYFNTLRMEVSNHNVNILSVCPGFVDIGPSRVLIGAKLGQDVVVNDSGEKKLSVNRCAYLIAITMANKIEEVWMSRHPVLLYTYMFQYLPLLAMKLSKTIGQKRAQSIKECIKDYQ